MRILIANTGHPATIKGGAEAAVLDLANTLAERGHEVSLVVHHGGDTLEERREGALRVFSLPNRNLYFGFDGRRRPAPMRLAWHALDSVNPWMARAFGQVLDIVRPEVVNTHVLVGLSQLSWREAAKRGIPIVHYLHEYGSMCPRGSAFRDGRLCATPCTTCRAVTAPRKHLSALVDTIVGVSRFTLQRHLDWGFFPAARRTVLPNIFRELAFTPRPALPPGSPLHLGFLGRLVADKGPQLLIEAVRQLPPGQWRLSVGGTGDESFVSQLKASAPEGVDFLGWSRPADVLPHLDTVVVPSVWPDPQPRTTFEAMMHGVPVIGARAGGIPEQIDEGRTGWLFEAGSADDLARVLRARLADGATRHLDPQGFRNRLARLDPASVADSYEDVFREAIDRRQPSTLAAE